jgi:hypothetical protein
VHRQLLPPLRRDRLTKGIGEIWILEWIETLGNVHFASISMGRSDPAQPA